MVLRAFPNCTFPTTKPSGFIGPPNVRSTMDIVWSCVSIILLSTWSVLHLTVPPDIRARSWLERFRKQCYLLERKLAWMGIMLAFPEYLVACATTNLFVARVNTPELQELANADGVPWSLTHTHLANMGGIAIRFVRPNKRVEMEQEMLQLKFRPPSTSVSPLTRTRVGTMPEVSGPSPVSSIPKSMTAPTVETMPSRTHVPRQDTMIAKFKTSTKSPSLPDLLLKFQRAQEKHVSGIGSTEWEPYGPNLALAADCVKNTDWTMRNRDVPPLQGNIWILDSRQLIRARKRQVIPRLPALERDAIEDKSKSDGLVRLIAVVQIAWLAVQLIARRILDIQYAPLEISTVAFSACAFLIYLAEWRKPKDVNVPIYVDTDAVVSPESFEYIARAGPTVFLQPRRYYMPQSCTHQVIEGRWGQEHVERLFILVTVIAIAIFGGIHVFAWNLIFPTPVERLLWRISALTVAVAPTVSALATLMESYLVKRTDKVSIITVSILAPAYLLSRCYIIVESFRSLYFLPREVFISTWAASAPHIG